MNLEQEITHDSSQGPLDESGDVDNPWIVTMTGRGIFKKAQFRSD